MKVLENGNGISKNGVGIGLGNFDGLHIGHMSLISCLFKECRKRNIVSVLYSYKRHTDEVLKSKGHTPQILTLEKKKELLEKTEIDYLYLEDFSREYANLSPEEFVSGILVGKFGAKVVVAGFNYTFGKKGAGDVELLMELGNKYGFECFIVPPIKIGKEAVSSTLVRKYVKKGLMEKVRLLTGRYYSIYGTVEMGRQIGSTIGFPTANIIPEDYLVIPRSGVYVTRTNLDGVLYNSITNVGHNPTFGELKKVSCETHIFGREGNLYGKRIEVFFMAKLRDERKFESKEDLCAQINMDINAAREFYNAL